MTMLTYREAARAVRRSTLTIKRWRRQGMPMGWEHRNGQRVRVVDEGALFSFLQAKLLADPVRQARVRARIRELATSPTTNSLGTVAPPPPADHFNIPKHIGGPADDLSDHPMKSPLDFPQVVHIAVCAPKP